MIDKNLQYEKSCKQCQKVIYKRGRDSKTQWKGRKFCSRECHSKSIMGMNPPNTKKVDSNLIISLYKSGKSYRDIRNITGLKNRVIYNRLKWADSLKDIKIEINKEILYKLYFIENKSLKECAEYFGCCQTSIRNRFNEFGFKARTIREVKNSIPLRNEKYRDDIIDLYVNKKLSCKRIAKKFNSSKSSINYLLNINGINTSLKGRPQSKKHRENRSKALKGHKVSAHTRMLQSRKRKGIFLGENNPSWIDGRSFLPYPPTFNNSFKRAIRKRDNYVCMKCLIHQEKLPRSLDVHHIDYIKENTFEQNCCALCNSCNLEVNQNRKHWTKFFQSLLAERYGYEYTPEGEAVIKIGEQVTR